MLEVVASPRDEDVESLILDLLRREELVGWVEIVKRVKESGLSISLHKLRRIILCMISRGHVVELPCRLFALPEFLAKPRDYVRRAIAEKIRRLGYRRCCRPLGAPTRSIRVSITKAGNVIVEFSHDLRNCVELVRCTGSGYDT